MEDKPRRRVKTFRCNISKKLTDRITRLWIGKLVYGSIIKQHGNSNLMERNSRTDMIKKSIYLRKDEFDKVKEVSGDFSCNQFMRIAIRRAVAEKENAQKVLQGQSLTRPSQAADEQASRGDGV
jgi:hypothetical protein